MPPRSRRWWLRTAAARRWRSPRRSSDVPSPRRRSCRPCRRARLPLPERLPRRSAGVGRVPPRQRGDDQLEELEDEQGGEERSDAQRQDRDGLGFQQVAQATERLGVEAWNGDLAAEAVNEKNACGEKQATAH